MATKMKGLFKGLRYISQIFEEGKEDEIQIGFPTDVKHVAHIGWDGPAVHESPSWMKEFSSPSALKSAPLGPPPGEPIEKPEVQWVSEDSKRGQRAIESQGGDPSHVPRSSRRHNSTDSNSNDSPRKKEPSSKSSRQSRRHQKDLSEGGSARKTQESGPSSGLPDIPKKSRRKKSKESISGDGSSRGKSTKGDKDPNGENGGGSSRGKSKRASKQLDPEIGNDSIEQIVGPQSGILDREEK